MPADDPREETANPKKGEAFSGRSRLSERLRHALWAGSIAFVLVVISALNPLDQSIWLLQSQIDKSAPSGEIVFAEVNEDFTDPTMPERRAKLATMIDRLNDAGAKRIFIDGVFDQASGSTADLELGKAIASSRAPVVMATHRENNLENTFDTVHSIPEIQRRSC